MEIITDALASSEIIRIFVAIGILAMMVCLIIEAIFGTMETFFQKNKVDNSAKLS